MTIIKLNLTDLYTVVFGAVENVFVFVYVCVFGQKKVFQ